MTEKCSTGLHTKGLKADLRRYAGLPYQLLQQRHE